jgi:hypothetical protein
MQVLLSLNFPAKTSASTTGVGQLAYVEWVLPARTEIAGPGYKASVIRTRRPQLARGIALPGLKQDLKLPSLLLPSSATASI